MNAFLEGLYSLFVCISLCHPQLAWAVILKS